MRSGSVAFFRSNRARPTTIHPNYQRVFRKAVYACPSPQSSPRKRGEAETRALRKTAVIKRRNVTGRAFADNADDSLRPARTSAPVRFASPRGD